MNSVRCLHLLLPATMLCSYSGALHAAQGEMGTGIPNEIGSYSSATGSETHVISLREATVDFPAGCSVLILTPETMGMDSYKIALASLLMAKATNRSVRFFAHGERDGGCGVDYVQTN